MCRVLNRVFTLLRFCVAMVRFPNSSQILGKDRYDRITLYPNIRVSFLPTQILGAWSATFIKTQSNKGTYSIHHTLSVLNIHTHGTSRLSFQTTGSKLQGKSGSIGRPALPRIRLTSSSFTVSSIMFYFCHPPCVVCVINDLILLRSAAGAGAALTSVQHFKGQGFLFCS